MVEVGDAEDPGGRDVVQATSAMNKLGLPSTISNLLLYYILHDDQIIEV